MIRYLGRGRDSLVYLIKENEILKVMKVIPFQEGKIHDYISGIGLQKTLSHVRIPKIYDIRKDKDKLYIFEEYIDGESLYHRIENKGSLSYQSILHLGLELIQIIKYLHHQKIPIIHLDLHPSNLIIKDNTIFLIDFGNAKEQGKAISLYGMRGYTAPEIYIGKPVDKGMDIYAFACILLYAATSQNPMDIKEYPATWSYDLIQLIQACLSDMEIRESDAREVERSLYQMKKEEENGRIQIIGKRKIFGKALRIGLIGSVRGVGVTFFAVTYAHFLKRYMHCKVAVKQECMSSDMIAIKNVQMFRHSSDREAFTMSGIRYIPYQAEENLDAYDIVISDYGGEYEYKYEEFIESDICMVVCDTSIWRLGALKSILGSEAHRQKRQIFVSAFGDRQAAKRIEKKYEISILKIPYSDSAFHIDKDMYIFLKNLCVLLNII